jgi:hypothetical protein
MGNNVTTVCKLVTVYGKIPPPKPTILKSVPPIRVILWDDIYVGTCGYQIWATSDLLIPFVLIGTVGKGVTQFIKNYLPEQYDYYALKGVNDYGEHTQLGEFNF